MTICPANATENVTTTLPELSIVTLAGLTRLCGLAESYTVTLKKVAPSPCVAAGTLKDVVLVKLAEYLIGKLELSASQLPELDGSTCTL